MPLEGRGASNSKDRARSRRLNNLYTATLKVRWPKGMAKIVEVVGEDEDGVRHTLNVYEFKPGA